MPTKKKTTKKVTTKSKTIKKPLKRKGFIGKLLQGRKRGWIKKRALLISAGILVLVGIGFASYAIYQNNSANAASFQGCPTLSKGSTGNCVKTLQTALNCANNAGLAVDGAFGDLTRSAVRAYQTKKGIAIDGVVGPQTAGKLAGDGCATAASGTSGSSGSSPAPSTPVGSADSTEKANLLAKFKDVNAQYKKALQDWYKAGAQLDEAKKSGNSSYIYGVQNNWNSIKSRVDTLSKQQVALANQLEKLGVKVTY